MPFTELCIYQVKPQKVDEFEALMLEAKEFLEKHKRQLFEVDRQLESLPYGFSW